MLRSVLLFSAAALLWGCVSDSGVSPSADTRSASAGSSLDPFQPGMTHLQGPANCYIASSVGEYCFKAKLVDGTALTGIDRVGVLWSTSGVSPLISEVGYVEPYVCFKVARTPGNAVIAAFDTAGKVVWSWHIWVTDQPATIHYQFGADFMDRDLGAYSSDAVLASYGLLYQWGRKDPFYGGSTSESVGTVLDCARNSTNTALGFQWTTYTPSGTGRPTDCLQYSIEHPTTFINLNTFVQNNEDWMTVGNDLLWGEVKTNYDPCPYGYRVPTWDEWHWRSSIAPAATGSEATAAECVSLEADGVSQSVAGISTMTLSYVGNYLAVYDTYSLTTNYFPPSGWRDNRGVLTYAGLKGAHWSCTVEGTYADGFISYNSYCGMPDGGYPRIYAMSVRCVKE